MLRVTDLNVFYGSIHALRNVSIEVPEGSLVSIVGANGAGKSTLLNTLVGLFDGKGSVQFQGKELAGMPSYKRAKLGICLVPEGRRVFPQLSVLDNLRMGAYGCRNRTHLVKRQLPELYRLFPILEERSRQRAGTLSGGEQQMLAIARALMSQPKLLMLDEPSMGLAPVFQRGVRDTLLQLKSSGMTMLLVEQNASLALGVADTVYLLEVGEMIEHGPVEEMRQSPRVKEAYLGG